MTPLLPRFVFLLLVLALAGCASVRDRNVVLRGLSPYPMPPERWAQIKGVYVGPVRAEVDTFFGTKGASASEARLEIYGTTDAPEVFFKWNTVYTSVLTPVGVRTESYTNIPERRYGVKGRIRPSSHAPDRLLLKVHPNVLSPTSFTYLLLRFQRNGVVVVDYLGHFGWRGFGRWQRLEPALVP